MKKVVTAQDIIEGAMRSHRRPKIRFPLLSADLNAQVSRMTNDPKVVRKTASPFVREILGRLRRP